MGRVPGDGSQVVVKLSKALRPVRTPLSLLAPEGMRPRAMKMWDKVSDEVLRDLLGAVGVQDPRVRFEDGPAMRLAMWGGVAAVWADDQ